MVWEHYMNKIQKYARFLELFCLIIVLPLLILSFLYKWFGGDIPIYQDISDCAKKVTLYTGLSFFYPTTPSAPSTIMTRVLAALTDGISLCLFLWGCFSFIKLLRFYEQGELFSLNTMSLLNKLSRIAFAWTLYEPIKFTLLSFITSASSHNGIRIISLGVTSNDIFHIFIVGFFLVITSLMHEAYELKNENDLTV